jgi:TraM recognition site of TraD and TraG
MSGRRGFTKVKVDGRILLGAGHELEQKPVCDRDGQPVVARSAGSEDSFELLGLDEGPLGQKLAFSFSDRPKRQLHIEGEGLTTSFGIFGAPGSGKTVLLLHLLEQVLAHSCEDPERRFGALILDPKAALIDDVVEMVKRAGRSDDLYIVNTDELNGRGESINVIDCSLDPHELGAILVLAGRSAGIDASDPFWFQEWTNLFSSTLSLLRQHDDLDGRQGTPVTLRRVLDAIFNEVDVGKPPETERKREIQLVAMKLGKRLGELSEERRADLRSDIQNLNRFFSRDYVPTIEAFVTKAFGMFRRSKLWCYSGGRAADRPFYEDIIQEGRIVLVSISPAEPILGKTLSTLMKSLFQRTVLGRGELLSSGVISNGVRPLVMACDEYSEIASEVPGQSMGDGQFLALARQYGCMALLATQSVNVLEASSLRDTWKSVFSNFAAKIYMRLVDNQTAEEASKLAGESEWRVHSYGTSVGGESRQLSRQRDLRVRTNLPTTVLTHVLTRGQGVVIGSLDGGKTTPGTYYLQVPPSREKSAPAARPSARPAARPAAARG